jgi:hypothetical protein
MLRTRSWVTEGSSPTAATRSTRSRIRCPASPLSCTLLREVSCTDPSPYSREIAVRSRNTVAVV